MTLTQRNPDASSAQAAALQPVQSGTREFRGVQALRGVAAALVVLFHATQIWSKHASRGLNSLSWVRGAAGVDVFFVISGFVMLVSWTGKQSARPALEFLERRLVRIVPLYWAMTTVALLVLLGLAGSNGTADHPRLTPLYVTASYLFIPVRDSLGENSPVLPVGWTLCYEMFFYALFALALALRKDVVRVLAPIMVTLALLSVLRHPWWPAITLLASPLLLEFLAGVLLGQAIVQGRRLAPGLAWALLAAGSLAVLVLPAYGPPMLRLLGWGLPAIALVSGAVMLEPQLAPRIPRWAILLGDSSYSLYLVHLPVLWMLEPALVRSGLLPAGVLVNHVAAASAHYRVHQLSVIALCVVCGMGVSLAVYHWVEQPVNQWLRGWLRTRHQRRRQAA
ncbi:MAG: acyltransferase [Acidobacteriota bacterium]|nr:acyltransferase [Acidobacteriota bacterium]